MAAESSAGHFSRGPRLLAWTLLIFPIIVILAYPFVQDYLRAASLVARIADPAKKGWLANYDTHPLAAPVALAFDYGGISVDAQVLRPLGVRESSGILLLVPTGRSRFADEGGLQLARELAKSGYSVALPYLAGDLGADRSSAELVAHAAGAFAAAIRVPRVGIMAARSLAGIADFANNTPEGSRSIAWIVSGEPIDRVLENPQDFVHLKLRERLSLVNWFSALIRQARNSPASKVQEIPAGDWIPASGEARPNRWLLSTTLRPPNRSYAVLQYERR